MENKITRYSPGRIMWPEDPFSGSILFGKIQKWIIKNLEEMWQSQANIERYKTEVDGYRRTREINEVTHDLRLRNEIHRIESETRMREEQNRSIKLANDEKQQKTDIAKLEKKSAYAEFEKKMKRFFDGDDED